MLKKILIGFVLLFVIIQFVRPARNESGESNMDLRTKYPVPDSVAQILAKACNDCHTNTTRYPWYANVQPVGWWLSSHIKDGKRHLNFNTFAGEKVARQKKRMEDCIEQIDNGGMPLDSYTWIHTDARLTAAEKSMLKSWCQGIIDSIKQNYPPDSLVLPQRKR